MVIDSIENGIVLDHIAAGKSMDIYNYLNLDTLECSVAIIKNAKSKLLGRKDIIKIENAIDVDFDVLGYIDPNITINVIDGGKVMKKSRLSLPETLRNVVKCKNPRCITSVEPDIEHIFRLSDVEKGTYRCVYCEEAAKR